MEFQSIAFLGLSLNQLDYIQAAKNLGYNIIGFDSDTNAPCHNLCNVSFPIRIDNHKLIIKELVKAENLIGCISEQTDNALLSIGIVNSTFNLLGPSHEIVENIKNKSLQRQKCKTLNIKQPDFVFCNTSDEFSKLVFKFLDKYKNIVVKPFEGQSSIGVKSISNYEFNAHELVNLYNDLSLTSGSKNFLIEEFVNGDDISIEGLVFQSKIHILAICHKTKCQSNPMVDKTLKVFAYNLTNHKLEFQLAKKLVQGFGLDNSFFHIEAKKKSSLSLIEWTPRGCGSRLSSVLLSRLYKKNIPVIRVSMFLKNYEFPKFSKPKDIGLLYFFDKDIASIEVLHSNIRRHIQEYDLDINFKNLSYNSKKIILDGRSRLGNIIAIGSKVKIKNLYEELMQINL